MKTVKVAVVGVGHFGQHHARIYSAMEGVELVGVADVDRGRTRRISQKCHTSGYSDHGPLLDRVDAASICTPTDTHYEIARDFLNAECSILIEKPMTQTVEEADHLLQMARTKDTILQVGYVERFNGAIQELGKIIEQPKFIECHRFGPFDSRTADVGVVLDLMIHDIDIILDLVKSRVKHIEAVGASVLSDHEDISNARLTFANGCIADLTASRAAKKKRRKIRVFQSGADITLDYLSQELSIYKEERGRIVRWRPPITGGEPLKLELDAFINSVRTHTQPLVAGIQGRDALAIALEISKQIKRGQRGQ